MGDLGVFEAMDNAGKLSAEAAANNGFELEKSVDRAIFRAKEKFGAYLANSQNKSDFDQRWSHVKPQVIKIVAEVTTPTPGVMRRVAAALRPQAPATPVVKKSRPSPSEKTAKTVALAADADGDADDTNPASEAEEQVAKESSVQKTAWVYDKVSHLYTSNDAMQRFACPGCGTEQEHIGFNKCAGCDRTWNSWAVRQAGSAKTGASTYVLMAREIKMRGDQFKLAAQSNMKISAPFQKEDEKDEDEKSDDDSKKTAAFPQDGPPPAQMGQPSFGTMPGDNSGAQGGPVPPAQPATPMAAAGDRDGDGDVAGGVTEDSPIDQIQDALQDAVVALKEVQMLSLNPALTMTASTKAAKVATLRAAMNRFWGLHKQMNYVAGMLAKEANEAIRTADPRITSEAQFIEGFNAAARNEPLPEKTGKAWLEGYVAFHKQADNYVPTGDDETDAGNKGSGFLNGKGKVPGDPESYSDAGPFDTSQPASREFASETDQRNNKSDSMKDARGQSSTMLQPTGARRPLPKDKR